MNGLILDVIIAVVAVLLIIFGIWRGMYKLIYGLVSSIAAVVIAILLASTVTTALIEKTSFDDKVFDMLDERVQAALPEEMHADDVQLVFRNDGSVTLNDDSASYESISEYLSTTEYKALGGILDSLVSGKIVSQLLIPQDEDENVTLQTNLSNVISTVVVVYVMVIVVFILLWILSYIVIRVLMSLLKKLVHRTYIGHFIDKLLGFVIGAALAMVLIWGCLAVVRLLGTFTWIISVNELINSSTITKLLYENNILYNMLVESVNLQETISNLIGMFASKATENPEGTENVANAAMQLISSKVI